VLRRPDGNGPRVPDPGCAELRAGSQTGAARRLVDAANAAGGVDNITVLVVDVVDDEDATTAVPIVAPNEPAAAAGRAGRAQLSPAGRSAAGGPRRWWRILRWALPIVIVVGVAGGVLILVCPRHVLRGYQPQQRRHLPGSAGGVLFWNPTLEQRTTLLTSSLTGGQRQSVKAGHGQFSSLASAQAFVGSCGARRRSAPARPRPRRSPHHDAADHGTTDGRRRGA